jgi:Flp pilus assembly protein TadD
VSPSPPADAAGEALAELLLIQSELQAGHSRAALERAGAVFASGRLPPQRLADLCRLTAEAAQAQGQLPLAQTLWRQAATLAPTALEAADALANLAVLLASQPGSQADASACCREALALAPDHAQALANLAVLLNEGGDRREAEALFRHSLAVEPDNPATLSQLGLLLAATRRPIEAEACQRRALALDADHPAAHTQLGLLLHETARLGEALPHLRRAVALAPLRAEVHSNLANLLAQLGEEIEAEASLRQALALDPGSAAAHCNFGVLLADQRRDTDAEQHFRDALALRPAHALARLNLSCLLLAQGRFDEGWQLHEARHDPSLPDNGIGAPNVALPRWEGESLHGRALLIWPEQGLGDQIQFSRFVPALAALGARRITLVCQRPLRRLFESLPGVSAVIAADVVDNTFQVDPAALSGHDCWTFPLSLPRLLGTDLSTLPQAPIPYLRAAPEAVSAWQQRAASEEASGATRPLRVGLVWRGNPLHNNDAQRSLPGLQTLAPLGSVPGVRFISLQTGRAAQAADDAPPALPLSNWGRDLTDFADTAAALAAIDLLICVDTSIAHLAGALARPCWVLLPHFKTDWRWLRDRGDSPWYAGGMRLFRQVERGHWRPVIQRVRDALDALSVDRISMIEG